MSTRLSEKGKAATAWSRRYGPQIKPTGKEDKMTEQEFNSKWQHVGVTIKEDRFEWGFNLYDSHGQRFSGAISVADADRMMRTEFDLVALATREPTKSTRPELLGMWEGL
jgi:hypothetical protein